MRFFLTLTVMLAVGSTSANVTSELTPSPNGGQVVRASEYQYLTGSGNEGWDQFEQVRQSEEWQTPKIDTLNVDSQSTLWIRIPLTAAPAGYEEWRLEVRWPHLFNVEMAAWYPNQGLTKIHRAGKNVPLSEIEIAHKNIVFPVHLPSETPTTLYLKIAGSDLNYLPMMLFSTEAYENHNATRVAMFSMVFGILAVMILYNLSLYFAVRDKMYLFYSNTVFSSLLYILAVSGYGRILFWSENKWLDAHAFALFASYCFLSVTYFFRAFLDLSRYPGWVLKANTFMIVCYSTILVITATPFAVYGVILLGSLSGILGVTMLVSAISVWRRGNPSAIYFVISWTGVGISTTFMVLTLRGQINYFPALEYSQASGFVLEVVLLSLALADRIRRQRIAKEKAQSSLLELQDQTNKQLETQVDLRTHELESAMVDLKSANRELAKLTKLDPLTNVNNRRQFDTVAKREIAKAQHTGKPLSLMMIDIDHFKAVNDTYGHVVGDKCLKLVAKCISENLRGRSDMMARYGGEEFALILPETEESEAHALAERIRAEIEKLDLIYEGKTVHITASFGVFSCVLRGNETVNTLVEVADTALYQAKENGRNQVVMNTASYSA